MNRNGLEYERSAGRQELQPGQVSVLCSVEVATGQVTELLCTDWLIESPNWTPDGRSIIVNGRGNLYRFDLASSSALAQIPTGGVGHINNDHLLPVNGRTIYFSAAGHLYRVPVQGGDAVRISNVHPEEEQYSYWLHGVAPDERMLAYVSVQPEGDDPRGRRNLALIPTAGGPDQPLSEGTVPYDGPEYAPDGTWLYYNAEEAATRPGHAQLFRMRPDGTKREQLTFDDRVNWFPHFSPDGAWVCFISYEPGTISHPADVDVELRLMRPDGSDVRTLVALFGGQGTLNTNSWAPSNDRFAYVAYPPAAEVGPHVPRPAG